MPSATSSRSRFRHVEQLRSDVARPDRPNTAAYDRHHARSEADPQVVPYLLYEDAGSAMDWLIRAFGFVERARDQPVTAT
jgi:hypothetical protein